MKTIKEIKRNINFCEAMINIQDDKKRDEFIKKFKIDVNNIGPKAWNNDEIDKIMNRAIEHFETEMESKEEILKIIQERIFICEKSYQISKKDKWVHIEIVLKGIIKEVLGEDNSVKSESDAE